MNTFKFAVCFLFALILNQAKSQIVLNGDFENNSALVCETNLSNSVYTDLMDNSWGFGSSNELDIQEINCGYAIPQSNNWFVSLSKRVDGASDELSLKLSMPLIAGDVYGISYLDFAADTFDNTVVPVEIGLSEAPQSFGTQIISSTPANTEWTRRSFTFIAPNNGQYLTVRVDSAGTDRGWIFVDDFEITMNSGITEESGAAAKAYPNPVQDLLSIESNFQIEKVLIYDALGKMVSFKEGNQSSRLQLSVSKLIPGYYMLILRSKKKNQNVKLRICKT